MGAQKTPKKSLKNHGRISLSAETTAKYLSDPLMPL